MALMLQGQSTIMVDFRVFLQIKGEKGSSKRLDVARKCRQSKSLVLKNLHKNMIWVVIWLEVDKAMTNLVGNGINP